MTSERAPYRRALRPAILLLGVIALVALWWQGGLPMPDRATVAAWVAGAGAWGPVLIVGVMIAAVVASPIPSAPIALAAGAAYGHYLGTVYVAIGAELGAMTAFLIARFLGRDAVARWLGHKTDHGLLGSQNVLTLIVFGSRLLPFVSFDAMSYAAGLSRLHLWRFSLATLAGILPASFVLAHFGSVALDGRFDQTQWMVLGLGLLTGLPILLLALRRRPAPDTSDGSAQSDIE